MTKTAEGTFEIQDWDEKIYQQLDGGGKLTEAKVRQKFTGDIEGEGNVIWLMAYPDPKTATFVGIQRVVGSIGGKKGSFLIQTIGTFDGNTAQGDWSLIPGSGTDELTGISGEGTFGAPHGSTAEYQIDYELPAAPRKG
jgi:hypothetical protein